MQLLLKDLVILQPRLRDADPLGPGAPLLYARPMACLMQAYDMMISRVLSWSNPRRLSLSLPMLTRRTIVRAPLYLA